MLGIAAHERAALQFEDLASAMDAGLPVSSLGGDPAHGDRVVHGILRRRGVALSAMEDAVLLAAWRAGRTSDQLRRRAAARLQRAEQLRSLWAATRYPLLLAGMAIVTTTATMAITGPELLIGLLVIYALIAGVVFAVYRAAKTGAPWLQRLTWLHALLQGLAELPYLETLQALYGAGVDLREAHTTAVASVQDGDLGRRLAIADRLIQSGQPLREGLQQAVALHPETRSLLATGELAGQLEDALGRAWQRRSAVTKRDLDRLCRWFGNALYGLVMVLVAAVVIRFYTGYFGRLGRF